MDVDETAKVQYPDRKYSWYVVTVLIIAYTFSFADRQILSLLVEPIRADLGISDTQISLLHGLAFAIFYAIMGIPVGRIADVGNRRNVIAVGIAVWSIATAACGLAKNFVYLFIARMCVGVGEATLSPSAYSMLSDYFSPKDLAKSLSIYSTGIYIGAGFAMIGAGAAIKFVETIDPVSLPYFGELSSWSLVFMAVGLPGLLVAILVLSTVREPIRVGQIQYVNADADSRVASIPVRDVIHFIRRNWRAYFTIFVGIALYNILGYGSAAWLPTFFIRTFEWTASEFGFRFGVVALVLGTGGLVTGGLLCSFLERKGYKDANLRVPMFAIVALMPLTVFGPLMSDPLWAFILNAAAYFFFSMPIGAIAAALQVMTPNQMRAQISALYLFFVNLIGIGLGPIVVALITDYYFKDGFALKYSLSIIAVVTAPTAALILGLGLKHYARRIEEVR